MNAPDVDIYDDDYWRGFDGIMQRRQGYFAAMLELDELSRRLSRQADLDYQERLAAEPAADRGRREHREKTLAALVIGATTAADATEAERLWAAVDALLREG